MKRRLVAIAVALVLAVVGGLIVFSYVAGADRRAVAGLEPVKVLEVLQPIPAGTPAAALGELVQSTDLPAKAVADGALSTLDAVQEQVTMVDLQPGEQLLDSRFTDPEVFEASREIEVPDDLHQVSIFLDPSRVLGGYLEPGDTVAVFISMTDPPQTRLLVNRALATRVQGGVTIPTAQPAPEGEEAPDAGAAQESGPDGAPAPTQGVMVTLALEVTQADEVVFAAEHGGIWLSLQPEAADDGDGRVLDRESVLP